MIRKRLNRLLGLLCMGILLLGLSGCNEIKVVEMNQGSESSEDLTGGETGMESGSEEDGSSDTLEGENSGTEQRESTVDDTSETGQAETTEQSGNNSGAGTTEIVERSVEEYGAISNELQAWWFKRNEDHQPSGCQEDFDIEQYHAYYVNKNATDNVIYLTFDCGYENGYTPAILDTLKEADVKAIFFVTQTFIRDNPDLVKRMKEEGHMVGNHTITHPSLPGLSIEEQRAEIQGCADYMKEVTGYEMDPYIRPPKGEYSERTLQLCEDMGYCTLFWSIAYLDYDVNNQPSPDYVLQHFDKYCHPGAMPLIHNVSSANTQALPQLIRNLREAGYRFGTVDEFCHF